jgi:hypothetical protein
MGRKTNNCKLPFSLALTLLLTAALLANPHTTKGLQKTHPMITDPVNINALKSINPDLTGTNVKCALIARSFTYIDGKPNNDYRPYTDHNAFAENIFSFFESQAPNNSPSPHSTALCSILFGSDPNAFFEPISNFRFQGVIPEADPQIYEFWHFLQNYAFKNIPPDANLITASFGTQFPSWWTRAIESLIETSGIPLIASAGNGLLASDPLLYPAAGDNAIAVGVVNAVNSKSIANTLENFALPSAENSSFGPTDDKRCKPDIVAPANCIAAGIDNPGDYLTTGNWSSFSTPLVAGTVAMLIQAAQEDPNLTDAHNSYSAITLKAILLNSAEKLPYWHKGLITSDDDKKVPLDYRQGAGMLDALAAYNLLNAKKHAPGIIPTLGWDRNTLHRNTNQQNIYQFKIDDPEKNKITATLTWFTHYQNQYPFDPLINQNSDLALELWAVDPNDPNRDILLDYSDSDFDNLEHIHLSADPNFTTYELVVTFSDIDNPKATDPAQTYAVAWSAKKHNQKDSIYYYDLNTDGFVDNQDMLILAQNMLYFASEPAFNPYGDINSDGTIDFNDFTLIASQVNRKADFNIPTPPIRRRTSIQTPN